MDNVMTIEAFNELLSFLGDVRILTFKAREFTENGQRMIEIQDIKYTITRD